jgi:AcrR family transcriptional regulator
MLAKKTAERGRAPTPGASSRTAGNRGPDARNRRAEIVAALRRCMIEKGYAETSLTDLAKAANMSVSHLLYYYPGKEAVLHDVSDEINTRILTDVTSYRDEPLEERIHVLADNVFVRGAIDRAELCIVREIMALGSHRPELRERLRAFNEVMVEYLEDLFAKAPRQPGVSATDAAEIIASLWIGLVTRVDYDDRVSSSRARRLFRQTLLSLANLDAARPASRPRKPRAATAAS